MNFLDTYIQKKKQENEPKKQKLNIAYILAGYPSVEFSKEFLKNLQNTPIDILEIGIPYSDPLADGKIISQASFTCAQRGITTDTVFDMLDEVKAYKKKPLLFLVYYNLILAYGQEKFLERAKEAGIDGLIVPDLPWEECRQLIKKLHTHDLTWIPLVSPTSDRRLPQILARQKGGFVYALGSIGITGGTQIERSRLRKYIAEVKHYTDLPVAIGFGIKNKQDVQELQTIADGVIVGTSIIDICSCNDIKKLLSFVEKLFG